jgi:hypothetical protein
VFAPQTRFLLVYLWYHGLLVSIVYAWFFPLALLLPKQTMHPATAVRINTTKVIQNAGPGIVLPPMLFICPLTYTNSAMSMANTIRVKRHPRKATREATRTTVRCVEKERSHATRIAAAAIGWITSPRVQELPMV